MITPCFAAWPIAAMIAVGVANTRAQGQNTTSFVEMVLWWIKGRMKQTPEELDRYFLAVIGPIL